MKYFNWLPERFWIGVARCKILAVMGVVASLSLLLSCSNRGAGNQQPEGAPARKPEARVLVERVLWNEGSPEDLIELKMEHRAIIIVAGDWTFGGSFGSIRSYLEIEEFYELVADQRLECWYCDVTSRAAQRKLGEAHRRIGISTVYPPYMLIVTNGTAYSCQIRDARDASGHLACIRKALAEDSP